MGNEITTKSLGDSIPFVFDRGGLSIDGWVCTINVKQFPGDTTLLSREIDADGTTWPGFLTSTETTGFGVGQYRLIGKLVNSSTDEQETAAQTTRFNLAEAFAD